MTIDVVKNIAELVAYAGVSPDLAIYVEGYYKPGDGGGGIFVFDSTNTTTVNLGIIFKSNFKETGRWIRQYSGHINVMYFGVTKYPQYSPLTLSNTQRLQDAINYCSANTELFPTTGFPPADLTLYFPTGSYWFENTIRLPSRIHLKGDNSTQLNLRIVQGVTSPNIKYFFEISDEGSMNRVRIENLVIDAGYATHNLKIGAFYIKATAGGSDNSGGLVYSLFKDLTIGNFGGHGIEMVGGSQTTNGRECNQFIYFDNVWLERRVDYTNTLKMVGTQVNMSFMNCGFGMVYVPVDQPISSLLGPDVYITSNVAYPPNNNAQISFVNCSTGGTPGQGAEFGFLIENAENITMENCWFEDSEIAVSAKNSQAINILNSRFANAGARGSHPNTIMHDPNNILFDHTGECIRVENSFVTIERNFVIVSDPNLEYVKHEMFIRGIGENNTINARNNCFDHILQSQTYGITQNTTIKTVNTYYPSGVLPAQVRGIETDGKKVVMVTGTTSDSIYRINSSINAGEFLFIKAVSGSITIYAMNAVNETSGRNILLGGLTSIVLQQGQGATFVKSDGVNVNEKCAYQMISKF